MEISQQRLRMDIEANAEFGAVDTAEGHGRTVLTGSEANRAARERLLDRFAAAGLTTRVDPVGNIAGRWVPDGVDPGTAPVAFGSHLDSVPRGGIFDGPLGVYAALEAVRAIQDSDETPSRPLEVVSFTAEEGARFGVGTLGSLVATGELSVDEALSLADEDGETLGACLEATGFAGSDTLAPSEWAAWFEVHVEQDTRLESAGVPVGIVDAIAGVANCEATFAGETDHAGSTSMADRRDSLPAAAQFIQATERIARDVAAEQEDAVATIGDIDVDPNVRNIVPGETTVQMDVRSVRGETIDRLVERFETSLETVGQDRPVDASFRRYRDTAPSRMSDRCLRTLDRAADRQDVSTLRLHSGAIHDTANVSRRTEAAMFFVPSVDGRSHSPAEWTDWDDCATASGMLAAAALEFE